MVFMQWIRLFYRNYNVTLSYDQGHKRAARAHVIPYTPADSTIQVETFDDGRSQSLDYISELRFTEVS